MYNTGLFKDWVPKPLQLILIILFMGVVMAVSGVFTGNLSFLVGGTGGMTEHFMLANYASAIGMGAVMPIALRMKLRFKVRDKVPYSLAIIAILLYMNGTTDNPWIIIINSLFIGFIKMMISLEFILPFLMMIPKKGVFYGLLYGFILTLMQLMNYFAVQVSIDYSWEHYYMIMAIVCLVFAALGRILMHDSYFAFKTPLHYIDWLSIILFMTCFMNLAYVLTFGRQQDWFNSELITLNTIGFVVFLVALVYRQTTLKRPYISFGVFKKTNVQHGLFMLFWLGMYMALGSMQTTFAVGILQYDQLTNAKLSLMMIPGILFGAAVAIYWFKNDFNVRMFVFSGFGAMLMFTIILYFSMVPEMNFEMWYLPMFLKGYGMAALFISVWFYTLDKLQQEDLLPAFGIVVMWRTFVTIGIFSAIFSWLQYQFQIQAIGDLAVHWDTLMMSPQTVMSNMKAVQLNAILVANKKLLGYVVIVGFLVNIYVYFHHFGRTKFVELKLVRLLKGKALIAKRRRREQLHLQRKNKMD